MQPERADLLFIAGALDSWLREGGDLVGDFWRVRGERGSKQQSPQATARRIREQRASSR